MSQCDRPCFGGSGETEIARSVAANTMDAEFAVSLKSWCARVAGKSNIADAPSRLPGRPNKRLHFALVFKGPKLGPQNQPFKDNPINH